MRCPIGSCPGQYAAAAVALTITTRGAVLVSALRKSRPRTSAIPIVWKYPGDTTQVKVERPCPVAVFSWPASSTVRVDATAEGLRHGPREGRVPTAGALGKEHDILVIGQEHQAVTVEGSEVCGGQAAGGDAEAAHRHVGAVPDAVDEGCPGILATVFLESIQRDHRRRVLNLEMDAVPAARHAQMRHLSEKVADVIGTGAESAAAIAVSNGAWIAEIESGETAGQEDLDDRRGRAFRVEECDADDILRRVPRWEKRELELRAREVEAERARRGSRAEERPFTDAQQEHDLVVDARSRGVEDRHDLEARQRWGHIGCGEQWVLLQAPAQVPLGHGPPRSLTAAGSRGGDGADDVEERAGRSRPRRCTGVREGGLFQRRLRGGVLEDADDGAGELSGVTEGDQHTATIAERLRRVHVPG